MGLSLSQDLHPFIRYTHIFTLKAADPLSHRPALRLPPDICCAGEGTDPFGCNALCGASRLASALAHRNSIQHPRLCKGRSDPFGHQF